MAQPYFRFDLLYPTIYSLWKSHLFSFTDQNIYNPIWGSPTQPYFKFNLPYPTMYTWCRCQSPWKSHLSRRKALRTLQTRRARSLRSRPRACWASHKHAPRPNSRLQKKRVEIVWNVNKKTQNIYFWKIIQCITFALWYVNITESRSWNYAHAQIRGCKKGDGIVWNVNKRQKHLFFSPWHNRKDALLI